MDHATSTAGAVAMPRITRGEEAPTASFILYLTRLQKRGIRRLKVDHPVIYFVDTSASRPILYYYRIASLPSDIGQRVLTRVGSSISLDVTATVEGFITQGLEDVEQ